MFSPNDVYRRSDAPCVVYYYKWWNVIAPFTIKNNTSHCPRSPLFESAVVGDHSRVFGVASFVSAINFPKKPAFFSVFRN